MDGVSRRIEIVYYYQKSESVNRYPFTWRTIQPNFILIQFETREPYAFWRGCWGLSLEEEEQSEEQQEEQDMYEISSWLKTYSYYLCVR